MEAKVSLDTAKRKAFLLAGGPVKIPSELRLPFPLSRSTAGPGAGQPSVVLSFGGTRAKKAVTRGEGDFELAERGQSYELRRAGEQFIAEVELTPTLLHAPFQAFVNIDNACVFDCKFCNSPKLGNKVVKNLTDEKIIDMIMDASTKPGFESVAFTSAVPRTRTEVVESMARLVRETRKLLPEVPIGVEPYATRPDEIDTLKNAGADEIKLNIETFDREIFDRVCDKMDLDQILHAINHSGEVFGRNRVCSNIIFGLGESDDNVLDGARVLANMGAVATLRALRRDELNTSRLEDALGPLKPVTADRMIHLAIEEKRVLENHGLSPLDFRTMCHSCLSCDIVPFWDV